MPDILPGIQLTPMEDPNAKPPPAVGGVPLQPMEPQDKTLVQKGIERFTGSDIGREDPQAWTRLGLQIVGTIGGGLAGAAAGAPGGPITAGVGAFVGAKAGNLAGAAAPETLMELGQKLGVLPAGTRATYGLNDQELKTVLEGEAIVDLATDGGISAARLASRTFTRFATGASKGAATAEKAAANNIPILPVQVGDKTVPRFLTTVFGRVPLLGLVLKSRAGTAEDALGAAYDKLPSRIAAASTATDVSRDIFNDATGLLTSVGQQFDKHMTDLYDKAEQAHIRITPVNFAQKAEDISLELEKRQAVSAASGAPVDMSGPYQKLYEFVNTTAEPFVRTIPGSGNTGIPLQSFQSIDDLAVKIDAYKVNVARDTKMADADKRTILGYLDDLSNQVGKDWGTQAFQVGPGGTPVRVTQANYQILQDIKDTGNQLTLGLSEVFESAAGKKFGTKAAFMATGGAYSPGQKAGVDALATILWDTRSAGAMDELAKLVKPETYQRYASTMIRQAVDQSMEAGGKGGKQAFNPDTFARIMGLDDAAGPRYAQVAALLKNSGGALTMENLADLNTVAKAMNSVEIPSTSQFLSRKLTIQNARSIGATVAGGAAGAALLGGTTVGGPMTGAAVAVFETALAGGLGVFFSAISNPNTARALSQVLDKEASSEVKKNAAIKFLRLAAATSKGQFPDNFSYDNFVNAVPYMVNSITTEWDKKFGQTPPASK